jgi:hypothetical protein
LDGGAPGFRELFLGQLKWRWLKVGGAAGQTRAWASPTEPAAPSPACPLPHPVPKQYKAMYKRSIEDPDGFWADIAREFHWDKEVGGSGVVCVCVVCVWGGCWGFVWGVSSVWVGRDDACVPRKRPRLHSPL